MEWDTFSSLFILPIGKRDDVKYKTTVEDHSEEPGRYLYMLIRESTLVTKILSLPQHCMRDYRDEFLHVLTDLTSGKSSF